MIALDDSQVPRYRPMGSRSVSMPRRVEDEELVMSFESIKSEELPADGAGDDGADDRVMAFVMEADESDEDDEAEAEAAAKEESERRRAETSAPRSRPDHVALFDEEEDSFGIQEEFIV